MTMTTPARAPGEKAITGLARLLVRVFFRRIDLAGADLLPDEGPVVLVANHVNGLVDGLVLISTLHRYPRFVGKATLFKILPLAPLLHLAGVVPISRAQDRSAADGDAEHAPTRRGTTPPSGPAASCSPPAGSSRCSPRASATTRPGSSPCGPAPRASRSAPPSTRAWQTW